MEENWLAGFSLAGKKIYVAGHRGMVGSAVVRRLESENCEILTNDLDLREQAHVRAWFAQNKPDVVVIAAAKVGGIKANADFPADFIYDNLMIEANVIHAAHEARVEKLLFLGSSCIYPKHAAQPMKEDALLSGALEKTNEAYAVAKIAGVKLCQAYRKQYGRDFISAMPCNLYGPGDKFDENTSHVIPALMMKAAEAKHVLTVWGSGEPLREFLYADDLADALLFLLKNYSGDRQVNIGSGEEISIRALAEKIAAIAGFRGKIAFDTAMPDGAPRKLVDSSRLFAAGWKPKTSLDEGLRATYLSYKDQTRHEKAA